jgi:hypothetical protein
MKTWLTSRSGITALSVLIAIGAGLALLRAVAVQGISARTIAASLLASSFVVFGLGGVLFAGRAFLKWQIAETSSYLTWERGFIVAAVLATVLGLALLEDMLRATGDTFLARLGVLGYLFGAVIVVVAETAYIGKGEWNYPQIALYVVLAFLAQAAIGTALLQTGLVPAWAGWTTVIWNVAWLLIMLVVRPSDIYYPVLHHVAPLIIGITLLTRG